MRLGIGKRAESTTRQTRPERSDLRRIPSFRGVLAKSEAAELPAKSTDEADRVSTGCRVQPYPDQVHPPGPDDVGGVGPVAASMSFNSKLIR